MEQWFIIFVIAYSFLSVWTVQKIFKIKTKIWSIYQYVNKKHKKVERWIFIGFAVCLIAFLILDWSLYINFAIYYFILFANRAFIEWKYKKETKEYVLSVLGLFNLIIFFIIGCNL